MSCTVKRVCWTGSTPQSYSVCVCVCVFKRQVCFETKDIGGVHHLVCYQGLFPSVCKCFFLAFNTSHQQETVCHSFLTRHPKLTDLFLYRSSVSLRSETSCLTDLDKTEKVKKRRKCQGLLMLETPLRLRLVSIT